MIESLAIPILVRGKKLEKGSVGNHVRVLQAFLNGLGVADNSGQALAVDGVMGISTRQAVKNYQALHPELAVDGVVGNPRLPVLTIGAALESQTSETQS